VHDTNAGQSGAEPHTHHGLAIGPRPLIVGIVHGLAGSGALMLLVLSTISSPMVGMVYILTFGAGSIGGMMLISLLLSMPFQLTSRSSQWERVTRGLAGVFSVGFGLFMAYQIAFTHEFTPH